MFKATIDLWEIKPAGEHYIVTGFTGDEPKMGNTVCTSRIELLNLKDGWVKTRNSFYRLGRPSIERRKK